MSNFSPHSEAIEQPGRGTPEREAILHARGIAKRFGSGPAQVSVLHGVNLQIAAGEFVAIMGESGSGKTTLLHILGLMSRPDSGSLTIQGREMTAAGEAQRTAVRRRSLGFVFQRFNLLGVLNAYDNVAMSLRVRGLRADASAIHQLLERMGVAHAARRRACKMSIGEQQRVAMARAIAHNPAILMADEPTGNLDSANAEGLLSLLREANRTQGQTILMITHSAEAAARADRILYMRDGLVHEHR